MEMLNALHEANKHMNTFVESMKDMPDEVKRAVICTTLDMMFGDKSVEVMESLLPLMKDVNDMLGGYED